MLLTLLKGKIHGATVTGADLHYQGSIAIDRQWLEEAGILPNEQVQIYNVTNGQRLTTYAIEADAGSRAILLNGAAARRASPGDTIIVAAYAQMDENEARAWQPKLVFPQNVPMPITRQPQTG
jgi:aspartate 1-decarboxylase